MIPRRTILCVDDERIVLTSLKEQLRRRFAPDLAVETAEDGDEALEVFDELRREGAEVPVVISDQIMPRMRGDELLTAIHRRAPESLSIMLTGQAGADAVGAAVNSARLYRYLAKPWAEDDLAMTVREAVRAWDRAREVEAANARLRETCVATSRFVPEELLRVLGRDHVRELRRGDQAEVRLTVLFCDIRGFTARTERLGVARTFAFLNAFFEAAGPVVRRHGGFIDNYVGDGLIALFPGAADAALDAALELRTIAAAFDPAAVGDEEPLEVAVGLHTGRVMVGILGEPERWTGTAIGDAVNVASRLEHLTRAYGEPLLVSAATAAALEHPARYPLRPLGEAEVRGKLARVGVFAL